MNKLERKIHKALNNFCESIYKIKYVEGRTGCTNHGECIEGIKVLTTLWIASTSLQQTLLEANLNIKVVPTTSLE